MTPVDNKRYTVKVPASAPVSPVTIRSNPINSENSPFSPVTPQRFTRVSRVLSCNPSPNHNFSTPQKSFLSRSYASSNGSTLATPSSHSSMRGLSLSLSPENNFKYSKEKSLADITKNWRLRANENGIKVTPPMEDPHYADDEASDQAKSDICPMDFFTNKNPLLSPVYRRPRAQSQALPPSVPFSPLRQAPQTPSRRALASMSLNINTPSPNSSAFQQLQLKGSLTEPPQSRRWASHNFQNRLPSPSEILTTRSNNHTELFDIDEAEAVCVPYPHQLTSTLPAGLPINLSDPFECASPLLTIADSAQRLFEPPFTPDFKPDMSSCSVCGRTSNLLAILDPCCHPLCSACLTSALNIVGEKDMACAVCDASVKNFHLQAVPSSSSSVEFSVKKSAGTLLPSAFDNTNLAMDQSQFFEHIRSSSTPVQSARREGSCVVLRIDNVPWDITPPAICAWIKQPVKRVHVLLDRKGKTLSHAFVEVENEEAARASLRSVQNSVLGKGKRARGVTVTRSSQEELMRAIFPSWQGKFDGARPSLAGLDNDQVIATLEAGLVSEAELASLLSLIRSPDSQFLKVPSLPFYSLISILSKFPADADSRVFWSGTLRDVMYDATYGAIQILLSRSQNEETPRNDTDLLFQLVQEALDCIAFTEQQHSELMSLVNTSALRCDSPSPPSSLSDSEQKIPALCATSDLGDVDCFDTLAEEFGLKADLVQALAQRLLTMPVSAKRLRTEVRV